MIAASVPQAGTPGRWFVGLGFLATTIVTTLASIGGNYALSSWQVTRTQQISDVNKFVDATEATNALVRAYVGKLLNHQPAEEAKEAVARNFQLQDSLLEDERNYLDENGKADVKVYRAIIVRLNSTLEGSTQVLDTGPFLQAVNNSLVQRSLVVGDLRRSAGLPGTTKRG